LRIEELLNANEVREFGNFRDQEMFKNFQMKFENLGIFRELIEESTKSSLKILEEFNKSSLKIPKEISS
jgi:hypothetical protein